jgi:SAM-dependent methyltransferase
MTDRALELLALGDDEAKFLLDIGCGSGLSGEILDEDGHYWVGVDVSPSMLEVAVEREVEGDLFLQDIGQGFGFRPGTFDGAIRRVDWNVGMFVNRKYQLTSFVLQHLGFTMATQRRLCRPFPRPTNHPILHYPSRMPPESISSGLSILPFIR